jgi:hypothetical protein
VQQEAAIQHYFSLILLLETLHWLIYHHNELSQLHEVTRKTVKIYTFLFAKYIFNSPIMYYTLKMYRGVEV